jgi:hypothetical protein
MSIGLSSSRLAGITNLQFTSFIRHWDVRLRRRAGLIGQHFDMADAAVIIDRDVDVLVTRAIHRLAAIPMNPMAGPEDARQRLDIEMHELVAAAAARRAGSATGAPPAAGG